MGFARKIPPRKRVYYIENTGGEKLQNTLVHEKTENSVAITEHPSMRCRDRAGHIVERHLWEVPYLTFMQCRKLIGKDGISFREYIGLAGEPPKQQPVYIPKKADDPFAEARRKPGRAKLPSLPRGVFRGSALSRLT